MQAIKKIKLGTPYGMPTKRLHKLLEQARLDCCKARNACMTHWLLWRRSHPDWKPGDPYDVPRKHKPPKNDNASAAKQPKDSPIAPRAFLSREMYSVARDAAQKLSAHIASSCSQEVQARLRAKTPYNHDGTARFVWQAILESEVSPPSWKRGQIPMPRRDAVLHYDDSECWLKFSLLSKDSGYRVLSPRVRLHVSKLSSGDRRLLRRIAAGEVRLADSTLYEVDGEWYANLCYDLEPEQAGCDEDRVLTLVPAGPGVDWPFRLLWTDADGLPQNKTFGKARPLIAEYRRIQARRRAIRFRYRDGCGSGHGRQRWARNLKPMERSVRDLASRWQKQFVSDVIKTALKEGCGTILYREPTMPLRNGHPKVPREKWEFFARNDLPFDWTALCGRLKFKAESKGLKFETVRIGIAEWRGEQPAEELEEAMA